MCHRFGLGFVLGQFALLLTVLALPAGDAWVTPDWALTVARWVGLAGMAVLIVGLINLGRSLTALPTPVPHGVLRTGGLYRLVRHPIYTGIMVLAVIAGRAAVTDPLAYVLLAARITQSFIHLASSSALAVSARFAAFAVQMGIAVYWVVRLHG